jgi:hypothetical protein
VALEKFVLKKVDTHEVCINVILLNERSFFWPKAHKISGTALIII